MARLARVGDGDGDIALPEVCGVDHLDVRIDVCGAVVADPLEHHIGVLAGHGGVADGEEGKPPRPENGLQRFFVFLRVEGEGVLEAANVVAEDFLQDFFHAAAGAFRFVPVVGEEFVGERAAPSEFGFELFESVKSDGFAHADDGRLACSGVCCEFQEVQAVHFLLVVEDILRRLPFRLCECGKLKSDLCEKLVRIVPFHGINTVPHKTRYAWKISGKQEIHELSDPKNRTFLRK